MPELAYSASRHRAALTAAADRDLLEAMARDDEQALDELITRKTRPLVQLVARLLGDAEEARDIVQVTFVRLWENRRKFDDRFSPNTWIYRIATNLAIDQWRSRKSRERAHEPVRHHLARVAGDGTPSALADLQQGEVGRIFEELATGLTDKQRLAFVLREVEGLSSQEVAAVAGCEESTVRNHVFNARKFLQRELLRRFPEYAARRLRPARAR